VSGETIDAYVDGCIARIRPTPSVFRTSGRSVETLGTRIARERMCVINKDWRAKRCEATPVPLLADLFTGE